VGPAPPPDPPERLEDTMTVHLEVHHDDEQIGAVDIVPVSRAGNQLDSINTYRWQYVCDGQMASGTITHRYGDGVLALIAKVLNVVTGHQRPAIPPPVPSERVPQRRESKWAGV
jgi:hypothetical protein